MAFPLLPIEVGNQKKKKKKRNKRKRAVDHIRQNGLSVTDEAYSQHGGVTSLSSGICFLIMQSDLDGGFSWLTIDLVEAACRFNQRVIWEKGFITMCSPAIPVCSVFIRDLT